MTNRLWQHRRGTTAIRFHCISKAPCTSFMVDRNRSIILVWGTGSFRDGLMVSGLGRTQQEVAQSISNGSFKIGLWARCMQHCHSFRMAVGWLDLCDTWSKRVGCTGSCASNSRTRITAESRKDDRNASHCCDSAGWNMEMKEIISVRY